MITVGHCQTPCTWVHSYVSTEHALYADCKHSLFIR